MRQQITMHPIMWSGNGPTLTLDHPFGFEVDFLPPGYQAFVNNFGTPYSGDWQIWIITPSLSTGWYGEYANEQAALAAVRAYVIQFVN